MLVLRQPQLLEEAPPQDLPRIFVGNLTQQILDSSLRQVLSRFGTVVNFARSNCSTFAHISLKADEESVAKCISDLNRVKWFGTSLRVEKARRHYLNRLRDEWKQQSCETQCIASETINEEQKVTSKPPFGNIPKGQHIRFSFPDEPFHVPLSSSPSQNANQRDTNTRPGRIKSSAFASKQTSLQTTLSLFGLSASQDENQFKSAKRSPPDISSSGRYNKRPRSVPIQNSENSEPTQAAFRNDATCNKTAVSQDASIASKGNLDSVVGHETTVGIIEPYSTELAEAVGDDPSKIDIERERSSYLQVFRSMFLDAGHQREKSEARNGSEEDMQKNCLTRHRRAALYTMLQTPGTDTCPLQITKNTASSSKSKSINDTLEVFARDPQRGSTTTESYRKVALYKKLQLMQPTDAL